MDVLYQLLNSPLFNQVTSTYGILVLLLATALFLYCVIYFWKTIQSTTIERNSKPWPLVIITMRDSFLIGGLYVVIEMLRSSVQYRAGVPVQPELISIVALFLPFIEIFVYGLIIFITFRRLNILRDWLLDSHKNGE